ncbi:hypothetical protein ASG30_21535 [Ramlibacter sp. Leaf400]|nr:hypothetical protein ASG30_21535 [Ramlibacter sp. Leaf400]
MPFCLAACGGGDASAPRLFTTFQAASVVLGQPTMGSGLADQGQEPNAASLDVPVGMALTPEGALLVADFKNNRVLLYGLTVSGGAAVAVLGQPNFQSSAPSTSRGGFNKPLDVATGAGRMAVADSGSNRVLIYDRIPMEGEAPPEPTSVIGQPDFDSFEPGCGPKGLNRPDSVAISPAGKLIVADTLNNRVLVWNSIPAPGSFAPQPDLVLGQGDLLHCAFRDEEQDGRSNSVDHTSARFVQAVDVWTDDDRLVVVDKLASRVLIWKTFPTVNFQPADIVLGHSTFTGAHFNDVPPVGDVRADKPTAHTLGEPSGVHSDGVSLAVADTQNSRVLIWNSFPQENYQPADVVLGQPDFLGAATTDQNGDGIIDPPLVIDAHVLYRPSHVLLTPGALITSDTGNNRVLIFRR